MANSNSGSNIMSVAEMIDTAFGEPDVNTVNHKLIQTILYILARQLRILERRVEIEIGSAVQPSSSSLSVTEVKVHAMQKKKTKGIKAAGSRAGGGGIGIGGAGKTGGGGMGMGGAGIGGVGKTGGGGMGMGGAGIGGAGKTGGGGMGMGGAGKTEGGGMGMGGKAVWQGGRGASLGPERAGPQGGRGGTMESSSDKTSSDKTSSVKTSSDKTPTDKSSSQKTSTDKTKSSSDKSASDKTSSEKTSSGVTSSDKTSSDKTTSDQTSSDKTSSNKTPSDKTSSDKTSSAKTSSDKTSSNKTPSDKTSSGKTSSDKTSSDKTSSDKTSSDKTSTDKTSSDKTSSDKTSSDKTSSDKTSSDKTSSDKTSSDKTSSNKTSSDKTSSDKTSSDKTSSNKTPSDKTSSDKTSSAKTSSDKTSSDKISSDKTTTDLTSTEITTTLTSSDKTTSGKTSSDKTSSDKTSSGKTTSDKISSDKTSTTKTSTDKSSSEPISSDKTSSKDKTSSSDKRSTTTSSKSTTGKSTSDKTSTEKSSSGKTTTEPTSSSINDPEYWASLLEAVEQQRETELRVIRQKTDSRQESDKTPSPMASLDSVEAAYEKLLIVERIPAEEARALAAKGRSGTRDKTPRISVVTQEQFENLAKVVRHLQQKFGPVGSASFPENIRLMQDLRRGASLTDAMAALQLSARLEASEKAMEQMMALVTDLASKTPGIDLTVGTEEGIEVLFGAGGKEDGASASAKSSALQKSSLKSKKEAQGSSSEESVNIPLPQPQSVVEHAGVIPSVATEAVVEKEPPDRITYEELDNAMQELYDNIIKTVNTLTTKSAVNADNAFKMASKLEGKLDASLNLGTRMFDLEALVTDYSEQINILDTGLSSQMTNYQEELTQMQHDLETALETMTEVLANAGGDTTAVAELNAHFSDLQSDIDDTMMRQKELRNSQNALAFDLDSLRKQIEILRDTKADREEVADALRDKAGLGALNGLISLQQFDAVRGDMEKRIGTAYEKFNSQETIWQKAIDDLFQNLNEKADWIQVDSLKDEINKHLEILRCRLNIMMEVVGEPKAAAVAKKLFRDATCLSCATPADMELEAHGVPALPSMRPPAIGAEAETPKEDGDHRPCFPGHPIPHPRDPRSRVCQRWCGGSHTVINNTVSRAPPSMIITPAVREASTALGTDGKMYMIDETLKPCRPCTRLITPQPSIAEPAQGPEELDLGSDMTPAGFRPSFAASLPAPENETPPPPLDDD